MEIWMARTVFCKKYKQELEGLLQPPFPGKIGADIYENVSQRAWSDWQTYQTMLINEKCLSLADPEARKFIQDTMNKFFSGEEVEAVEGYIPPTP